LPNIADKNTARLVLGTAQLGADYGIANSTGQPDQHEANAILQTAWNAGMRTLDTAQAYGNSEIVIGHFLKASPECPFNIITKLAAETNPSDPEAIKAAVDKSCLRLGRSPEGFLLHNGKLLNVWNGPLGKTLLDLKRQGKIGEIGVSIYEPDEFQLALSIPEIKFIQAPFNVIDQRLLKRGLLKQAQEQGRRIFLRSTFLQGLLLIQPQDLPSQFNFAKENLQSWWELLDRFQLDALAVAIKYILNAVPEVELVIGLETVKQLSEIVKHVHGPDLTPDILAAVTALPQGAFRLINPAQWEKRPS